MEFLKKNSSKGFLFGKERKILSFLRNFKIARIPFLCAKIFLGKTLYGEVLFSQKLKS